MRTFIAIDLSDENKQALARLQEELKQSEVDAKWVEPDNIHLTLKFLGEVTDECMPKVKEALDKIASQFEPFEITLSGIGMFPKPTFPRAVWVGIGKGKLEVKKIAEKLDEELSKLGFAKEAREFTAHLTIGRIRSGKNRDQFRQKLSETSDRRLVTSDQQITSIALYQSTLTPQGPTYTCLHEAKLSSA